MTDECNCASGTALNDGYAILEAVRLQHRTGDENWKAKIADLEYEIETMENAANDTENELNAIISERDDKALRVDELEYELICKEERISELEADAVELRAELSAYASFF